MPSPVSVTNPHFGCVDRRLAAGVGSTNKDAEHHRAPKKASTGLDGFVLYIYDI